MTETRKTELRCPICKKEVQSGNADFPFCGERCRTIDLGNWASGAYAGPSVVPDIEDQIPGSTLTNQRDEDS
jgi:uncharacterized protein